MEKHMKLMTFTMTRKRKILEGFLIKSIKPLLKGCVRYIFASLFCKSKREHCEAKKNGFYFT